MALCRFFARGTCFYGASCRNSHDAHASAASASSPSQPRIPATQEGLQRARTKLTTPKKFSCWFFTQGKCEYGDSCKNIHDPSPPDGGEHRSSPSQMSASTIALSADNGAISRANAELEVTMSPKNPLKPEALSFTPKLEGPAISQHEHPKIPIPCRFFARHFCKRGNECAFLHTILRQGELVQSLDEKIPEQQVRISASLYLTHTLLITTGSCP
jgi:hypothetical protein